MQMVSEFVKNNIDLDIVTDLGKANASKNRPEFHRILKRIEAHLYAAWVFDTNCSCIDCISEFDRVESDLILGVKELKTC